MERSPGDDRVPREVAWHNKHPLAQRIGAGHVHGLRLVALAALLPRVLAPAAAAASTAVAGVAGAAGVAPAPAALALAPAAAIPASAPRAAGASDRGLIAGRRDRPQLVGPLDEAAKAVARTELNAARAALGRPAPPERVVPRGDAPASAAAGRTVWAVTTRPLRTRFESEQMVVALRDVAARAGGNGGGATRVEVLPAGDDLRAVNWPYARREDAERIRALLVARGIRAEVIAF